MTRPTEQWPALFWFFDVLHQDYDSDYADPDACMADATADASMPKLQKALAEWHNAFDGATDEDVAALVQTFNPWWEADHLFGGYRGWAEWVRQHLEREIAARAGE